MLIEALLQMCGRDVVDNHKSCSEYFWLMNRYAIMVTTELNCFLFFSQTHSSFCTYNLCTFYTIRYFLYNVCKDYVQRGKLLLLKHCGEYIFYKNIEAESCEMRF